MKPRGFWLAAALVSVIAAGCGTGPAAVSQQPAHPGSGTPAAVPGASHSPATVYVHYYLWWTAQHWNDKLGPAYPYSTAPLPGSIDGQGCNPSVAYSGAQIVDIPAEGLYDQTQGATFERHVQLANQAGLKGFLADWQGTGSTTQGPNSSGYNSRFDLMVTTVDAYNTAHGTSFGLGLAYAAFGDYSRPASKVIADLQYFVSRYGSDPAFRNGYSPKPIVMWLNSRKYSPQAIQAISRAVEPYVYLLGDETAASWPNDGPYLDGTSYYWSTQDPWNNSRAGSAVSELAGLVHADGKQWFAPFIAGYNKQLMGGTCVERRGTQTLTQLWQLNSATQPNGWFGISWNEFVENTYLEPSKRYGSTYLDALSVLIKKGS